MIPLTILHFLQALVPNATTALNIAVSAAARSMAKGDGILLLDAGYGSVTKLAHRICSRVGGHVVEVPVLGGLPESGCHERLLSRVEQCLNNKAIKVAVFDHVTSNTALQLPVTELAALV